ncbi:MAG: ankyrin repeat domain-containing protein, partial [Candidatus Dadabacteria bacterium]|nr:ankyrin repeat domain-containing protein [Candidatus Dadabacteria bacterium]
GNTEIVKLLLDNGADINVKLGRKDASTLAERRGETELAELLREHANSHK